MLKKSYRVVAYGVRKLYFNVISGIALYPTLIAVGLFFLSLLTLYIDERSPGLLLGYEIPIKNILYPASARTLLGVIAGGMISLMVFSFSMVMVILSQTSSNYSPRLLPNLIGQRSKQIVMGFYIGTIAYTFTVLTSIDSKLYAFGVPTLSIIFTSLLSLVCLALFVSFINEVSKDIQIGNIINHVYRDTLHAIRYEKEKETYVAAATLPDTRGWTEVASPRSGYLNAVSKRFFLRATRRFDLTVTLCVPLGKFINRLDPLFLTSRPISDKEREELMNALVFRHQEDISQQYGYGVKHLTEVALKALSPGINDPGTAVQAIDRLTDLLVEVLSVSGQKILTDKQQRLRLIYEPLSFAEMLYLSINAIREYGQGDFIITLKLLTLLYTVSRHDVNHHYTDTIMTLLHDLAYGYSDNFSSQSNRQTLISKTSPLLELHSSHPSTNLIHTILDSLAVDQDYEAHSVI
jgi:uncharacterized membrane protein